MWTLGCLRISPRGVLQNNPSNMFYVTEGVFNFCRLVMYTHLSAVSTFFHY
jgi:hypothetical protein